VTPTEHLAAGELTAALEATDPLTTVPNERLLRAELLALKGGYREAAAELRGLRSDDPAWPASRKRLLHAFRGSYRRSRGAKPAFLREPPMHARKQRAAHYYARREEYGRAVRAADRALDGAPQLAGHIDGREFEGLRDADDRLATVFELLIDGEYTWLPWSQCRRLTLLPAKHPFDCAVRPGRVILDSGTELDCQVPLIYPGDPGEDLLRLGLDTDLGGESGLTVGLGAKLLFLGEEEIALGDVRQIDLR
jgi:type VI secretion system protein ImpE